MKAPKKQKYPELWWHPGLNYVYICHPGKRTMERWYDLEATWCFTVGVTRKCVDLCRLKFVAEIK